MVDAVYSFGSFRFEIAEHRLIRDGRPVHLPAKAFDTLRILLENCHRLVRKRELIEAVWPDSFVEEGNIDHNISVIRKALGQHTGEAIYIETVPRQGYRFVAPVEVIRSDAATRPRASDSRLVEREEEMAGLQAAVERAAAGERQLLFVTGEAGIGKTTLVRAFLDRMPDAGGVRTACGDCLDSHSAGEPYGPFLEALGRLGRAEPEWCVRVLARHAPTWLAQMPALAAEEQSIPRPQFGITTDRMVREMAEALEVLSAKHTLLLVLEDLHWADVSTIDLLSRIAQRRETAKLMILGTFRPSDAKAHSHPLHSRMQLMKLRGCCREIPLRALSVGGIERFLRARFGGALPAKAALTLHGRTQGNPLFVASVVDSWVKHGALRQVNAGWSLSGAVDELPFGIPDTLRQFIQRQIMDLDDPDREIVEAASVAGSPFCPAAIADALDRPVLEVEAHCARMAQDGRFFAASGVCEWPDGTMCDSYSFLHSVHREVIYDRLPSGRRVRLHQQIADRLETAFRGCEEEIAVELAAHFCEARDAPRALRYLHCTALQARARSAHHEVITHLTRAIDWVRRLPDLAERERQELKILSLLAPSLAITRGFGDRETEKVYRKAYELALKADACAAHFPIVFGLSVMLEFRAEYAQAQELMERHLPQQQGGGEFELEARDLLACSQFHQGAFADALLHGQRGAAAYSPQRHSLISASLGEDPGIDCHSWVALSLWFLGYPDRALAQARLAVSLATDPSRLYSLACAQTQVAFLHQLRQEEGPALDWAAESIMLAEQQGFPYRRAVGRILHGWATARRGGHEEGLSEIRDGMKGCAEAGAELDRPYHLALLAEILMDAGRVSEALAVLDEAVERIASSPAFFYSSEIYRLRGIAGMLSSAPARACERHLLRALEIAESQDAVPLALRAALDLAELWDAGGESGRADELVRRIHGRFTEGFSSPEMVRASRRLWRHKILHCF